MPPQGYSFPGSRFGGGGGYKQADFAATAAKSSEEEHDIENESQEKSSILNPASQESGMFGRRGDDAQEQIFSDVLLPRDLEDLLAQWTTLDKHEIQRGRVSAFQLA